MDSSSGFDAPPRAPVPVVSLEYALNLGPKRPNIITAVGVLSITFGIIGILYSGIEVLTGAGMLMMARMAPRMNAAMATANNNWSTAPTAGEMDSFFMGLDRLRPGEPLTERQRAVLRAFLTDQGQMVLGSFGRPISSDSVVAAGSRPQPAASAFHRVYEFPAGVLEISDQHALWLPGAIDQGRRLTSDEVEQVVRSVARVASSRPTAEQYQALRAALRADVQWLIPANAKGDLGQQISGALVRLGGALTVFGQSGAVLYVPSATGAQEIELGVPGGNGPAATTGPTVGAETAVATHTVNVSGSGVAVTTATTNPTTNPAATLTTFNFTAMMSVWAMLAIVAGVLSLGLAIFLLVIGVQVFRSSPRGRRRHRLYAWLKIATVLGGTAAATLMMSNFVRGFTPAGPAQNVSAAWSLALPTLGLGLLRLGYPIGLLIVMKTQRVKEYYAALGER